MRTLLALPLLAVLCVGCLDALVYDRPDYSSLAVGDTVYFKYGYEMTFGTVVVNDPAQRVLIVDKRNTLDMRVVDRYVLSYERAAER